MGEKPSRIRLISPLLLTLMLVGGAVGQTGATPPPAGPQLEVAKTDTKTSATTQPNNMATPSISVDLMRQAPQAKTPEQLRLGTELVTLSVTVTDPYGRFVTGLNKDHFEVFEDKVKQHIEFFSDLDAPLSLGIVFDVSGSMKSRVRRAHEALRKFIDASHKEDDFFLIGFNTSATVIRDFTTDGAAIANALSLVEPKGSTALYDAAYLSVEKVRQGRHTRRAVIIISDGQDNNSRYTYRELRKIIKEADVQIYALGITDLNGGSAYDFQGQAILEEIARTTGGRAFFPNNEVDLEDSITRIALELRHQYSLAYYPQETPLDGKWHKLKVVVNPPKGLPRLTVRAREGYFSQKPVEPVSK